MHLQASLHICHSLADHKLACCALQLSLSLFPCGTTGQRFPKELELGLLESQGVAVGAEAIRPGCDGLKHFFLSLCALQPVSRVCCVPCRLWYSKVCSRR